MCSIATPTASIIFDRLQYANTIISYWCGNGLGMLAEYGFNSLVLMQAIRQPLVGR